MHKVTSTLRFLMILVLRNLKIDLIERLRWNLEMVNTSYKSTFCFLRKRIVTIWVRWYGDRYFSNMDYLLFNTELIISQTMDTSFCDTEIFFFRNQKWAHSMIVRYFFWEIKEKPILLLLLLFCFSETRYFL